MKTAAHLICILLLATAAYGQSSPTHEFLAGDKLKYSSAGNPKAKGLTLTVEYPRSWSAQPGERPNIPQKFISGNGKGLEMAIIIVKEFPRNLAITDADVTDMFTQSSLKESVPEGAIFLDGKQVKVDGLPGAMMRFIHEQDRVGIKTRMISEQYMAYYNRRLISVQFAIYSSADESSENLAKRYEQFAPLFKLMANSIIVHDRYK